MFQRATLLYKEKRWFPSWYYLAMGLVVLPLCLVPVLMIFNPPRREDCLMIPSAFMVILVIPMRMHIKVSDKHLLIRLGWIYQKRIQRADIMTHEIVHCNYPIIGGHYWGAKRTYKGKPCRFYFTGEEEEGVLVTTHNDRFIVFSKNASALNDALG